MTFPAAAAFYNDSGWNLSTCGGGTGNVCGTATDATSGVASTQVSIQQGSTSKYWDPNTTSFSSVSEVKVTALGTTSWSLGLFPAANFPAEGSYTVRSYATDAAGNASATPAGTTFAIDRTAPTQALLVERSERRVPGERERLLQERRRRQLQARRHRDGLAAPGPPRPPSRRSRRPAGRTAPRPSAAPRPTPRACTRGARAPRRRPTSRSARPTRPGTAARARCISSPTRPRPAAGRSTPRASSASARATRPRRRSRSRSPRGATAAGSGVAATGAVLKREQGTLSSSDGQANGTCDYTGQSYSTIATDPAGPYTDNAAGGILTGKCYRYQYVVPDNVGNQVTYTSGDIKVETASPASLTPVITPSGASGNTAISGGTVFIEPAGGQVGRLHRLGDRVRRHRRRPELNFPTLTGFSARRRRRGLARARTRRPTHGRARGDRKRARRPSRQRATRASTRTATFTVTADTTAPTTTASGADASWHNAPVTVSLSASDGAGAGVSSVTYQVDSGSPSPSRVEHQRDVTAPSNGSNDGTHTITYYATDAVGNVESAHSVQVKIDTQAPTPRPRSRPRPGATTTRAGTRAARARSAAPRATPAAASRPSRSRSSRSRAASTGTAAARSTSPRRRAPSRPPPARRAGRWRSRRPTSRATAPTSSACITTDALGNTAAVGSPSRQITFVFDRTAPAATSPSP